MESPHPACRIAVALGPRTRCVRVCLPRASPRSAAQREKRGEDRSGPSTQDGRKRAGRCGVQHGVQTRSSQLSTTSKCRLHLRRPAVPRQMLLLHKPPPPSNNAEISVTGRFAGDHPAAARGGAPVQRAAPQPKPPDRPGAWLVAGNARDAADAGGGRLERAERGGGR